MILALAGKPQEALTDFEQAVSLEPTFADPHANVGLVRLTVGNTQGAVESLTQALELAPAFALAYNARGAAYALMEAWDEAERDFTQATVSAPTLPYARGNAQYVIWTKGQLAFRHSLQGTRDDGRGSTLIAQSYEHRVVDVSSGRTMGVFLITATPQTKTLEGMTAVVQDTTQRLRTENRLPNTWQLRLHEHSLRPGDRVLIGSVNSERAKTMLRSFRAGGWPADWKPVTNPAHLQSLANQGSYTRILMETEGTGDNVSTALLRDVKQMPAASLPSMRTLAQNVDRFNQAVSLVYKLADKRMPPELKVPLTFASPILQDLQATRAGQFNPWTSQTLERVGQFGLKELPTLVNQLV